MRYVIGTIAAFLACISSEYLISANTWQQYLVCILLGAFFSQTVVHLYDLGGKND